MSRLAAIFEKARRENRAAFIGYLTAGDPTAEATVAMARALARAGTDILELGVPFSDPIADGPVLRSAGLDTVFLVSPTSPAGRMREAARLSSGFLYVVSRSGTTGARTDLSRDLKGTVARARRASGGLPIAVGFGIATPETARRASRLADGVVVGSALMRAVEEAGEDREKAVERLARALASACRRRGRTPESRSRAARRRRESELRTGDS